MSGRSSKKRPLDTSGEIVKYTSIGGRPSLKRIEKKTKWFTNLFQQGENHNEITST